MAQNRFVISLAESSFGGLSLQYCWLYYFTDYCFSYLFYWHRLSCCSVSCLLYFYVLVEHRQTIAGMDPVWIIQTMKLHVNTVIALFKVTGNALGIFYFINLIASHRLILRVIFHDFSLCCVFRGGRLTLSSSSHREVQFLQFTKVTTYAKWVFFCRKRLFCRDIFILCIYLFIFTAAFLRTELRTLDRACLYPAFEQKPPM